MANQLEELVDLLAASPAVDTPASPEAPAAGDAREVPSTPTVPAAPEMPVEPAAFGGAETLPTTVGDINGPAVGWPVETADAFLLDPQATLGVCTLGDPDLAAALAAQALPGVAAIGPLATENVGLEKLIRNVLALPSLTLLLLVGPETGGTAPTGHYAGDALVQLLAQGWDPGEGRIRGARGQRPFLRNLAPAEVAAFRARIEVVDRRGLTDRGDVLAAIRELTDTAVGDRPTNARGEATDALGAGGGATEAGEEYIPSASPAGASGSRRPAGSNGGQAPATERIPPLDSWRWRPDPAGYVLVFADHAHGRVVAEHYTVDDRRTVVVSGEDPRLVAVTLLDRGLVTRLDHAAYVGRELERAARAVAEGRPYVQDAAPGQ